MGRFKLFLLLIFTCFYSFSQIIITNKLVNDSLKNRINSIHTKIYKSVESGMLKIYTSEGKEIKPSTVLSNCISTDSIDCDSSKVSINEFKYFTFNYLKKFDFETMNTSLKVESFFTCYRTFFAGIELGPSPHYRFKLDDLKNILEKRDWDFIKFLSASYNDLYYYRKEDSIITIDGYRTKAQVILWDDGYALDEANRSINQLDTGFSYGITFDSTELGIVSKVLFHKFKKGYYERNPIQLFQDSSFKKIKKTRDLYLDLFYVEYHSANPKSPYPIERDTVVSAMNDLCDIQSLTIKDNAIKIQLRIRDDNDSLDPSISRVAGTPLQTYYFKPEDLPVLLGKFQYLFLKNLFGF